MATVRTLIGNIKGPKGDTGATGATGPQGPGATIEVGTVSTTAYGNPVQITNSGTETDAVLDFVIPQGKPGEQTTKMSLLTLDTITTQTAEYPIPAVGDVGSTAWGKIVKFFNDIKTAVTGKVDTTSIVNNLTSTSTDKPLSAAQGKALNDAIAKYATAQAFSNAAYGSWKRVELQVPAGTYIVHRSVYAVTSSDTLSEGVRLAGGTNLATYTVGIGNANRLDLFNTSTATTLYAQGLNLASSERTIVVSIAAINLS